MGKELRLEAVLLLGADLEYELNAPLLGTGERLVYDLVYSALLMLLVLEAIFCFGRLLTLSPLPLLTAFCIAVTSGIFLLPL